MSALLSDDMLTLLAATKGKTLKSLEYVREGGEDQFAFEFLRLRLVRSALLVTCLLEATDFFGMREDVAAFRVRPDDLEVPLFDPAHYAGPHQFDSS